MQTQCPHCNTVYTVASGRKRRKSMFYCKACDKKFKITEIITGHPLGLVAEANAEVIVKPKQYESSKSDKKSRPLKEVEIFQAASVTGIEHRDATAPEESEIQDITERMPWELDQTQSSRIWTYGAVLGVLLFAAQLIYFEWDDWGQNRSYRPYLEGVCRQVGCRLAAYRNLAEFEVIQGGLTTNPDNTLSFKAVISNHAPYPQRMPDIKLNLLDFNEIVFAEKTFAPKEYGTEFKGTDYTVPAEETFAVQLLLAKPVTPVGGYTLDLAD